MCCTITCGYCHQSADLDQFCKAEIFGTLPKNVYQCPRCQRAFERRFGAPEVTESGFVLPGKVEIVEVQGYL